MMSKYVLVFLLELGMPKKLALDELRTAARRPMWRDLAESR